MGISIGIVGLGAFGSEFVRLFAHHPWVDRIALCDREPERVAAFARDASLQGKLRDSDLYPSLDEICASDVEALAIITQPWLHAPQAVQAMEAGKHVYTAVPVIWVPDGNEILEWCDRLIATCRRTGMKYMLGETTFFHPQAMYCRRRARERAFGDFVYAEGEYLHDVDNPWSNLREVWKAREASAAGQEWKVRYAQYVARGIMEGPMHYPTHSVSGPMCVMRAHATRAWALPYYNLTGDEYFGPQPSNETALFAMSNGATMRICEYREIGHRSREEFRVYGTRGSFEHDQWCDKASATALTYEEMRDPLPPEVVQAYLAAIGPDYFGGHEGSHAYLVHEFVEAVARDRAPAINAWEAARYMAAGVSAHKSALRDGEVLEVPDWGDAPS
jgi:predicted dehydrogenase